MINLAGMLPALLLLAACAPIAARENGSASTFRPGGQTLALICGPGRGRVADSGDLVWDEAGRQQRRPAPYLLSCYDYTLRNDGATLSVQDDTLAKALTHFDPSASFLMYAPGRSVTFPRPGLVGADLAQESGHLPGPSVLVRQSGQPEGALLKGGVFVAQRYDPAQPLTLSLTNLAQPVLWPEVTVWASKGLITAPVPRARP